MSVCYNIMTTINETAVSNIGEFDTVIFRAGREVERPEVEVCEKQSLATRNFALCVPTAQHM